MTNVENHPRTPAASAAPKYAYAGDQRPLDGYTIKHCIGKGGFGEVYFGLSDGGKEVALKLIRDNLQVELRGTVQCLNLKHPNLVHLYDLRTDGQGQHWLIMEYVEGQSLRTLLDRHPQGVAPELAVEWFQGLAAGVQYLHDHGIVHRDLKPGNIFLEKGHIKVGDYSLCKVIDSDRGAQTQSVGTVHYMAPEISTGNYNRQVDVYAAGIVLHELLTGRPPFEGDSAGEILMKHLTSMPDLSKVPSLFVPILDQALRKNPSHRFASMADMARKVEQIRDLGARSPQANGAPHSQPRHTAEGGEQRRQGAAGSQALTVTIDNAQPPAPQPRAWMELAGSALYVALLAGLGTLAWSTVFTAGDTAGLVRLFVPTALCSMMVLALGRVWTAPMEDSSRRRLIQFGLGMLLGLLVLWLDGYHVRNWLHSFNGPEADMRARFFSLLYPENLMPVLFCYVGYYGLMLGVLRWWRLTELGRPEVFSLKAVVATMLCGLALAYFLPSEPERQTGFASLVMASGIVQLASRWKKTEVVRKKRFRLPGA